MNDFFCLSHYLLFNLLLCLSFLCCKMVFNTSIIQKNFTQTEQLHLIRRALIFLIFIFCIAPYLVKLLALSNSETLPFSYHLKQNAGAWLPTTTSLPTQVKITNQSFALPSVNLMLNAAIISGIFFAALRYALQLYKLWKLTKNSFAQKQIGRVCLIYNDNIAIPFCWSSLNKHYILLPTFLLQTPQQLRLALRHEAAHVRQGDTHWLHITALLKILCVFNPFIYLWRKWFHDLQEFACDETLITRHHTDRHAYAQCLLDFAKRYAHEPVVSTAAIAFCKKDYSILTRRVTMIFDYHFFKTKKLKLFFAYAASTFCMSTLAYAMTDNLNTNPISEQKLESIVRQSHLNVTITPEVVAELNRIITTPATKAAFKQSFHNMQEYKPYISEQLTKNGMPKELLALPLVESGYKPLPESANPVKAAGIWQFIPSTAKTFGLKINKKRDDRLNTQLSTQAAIAYLQALHGQFDDWKLAVIAYEVGEKNTDSLIKATGATDPWELIRLAKDIHIIPTKELTHFFASYEAAVILINNPVLLT